jgi:alkylation response protein AidB-like acyl-CoA dehydrogenase
MSKLVDLKDIRFVLYEQLKIEENLCQFERFRANSEESFEMILKEAQKVAENDFAPINGIGDQIGCIYRDGEVAVPEQFHAPFQKYCQGGWISMSEDYSVGGQHIPLSISLACNAFFFAANHSLAGYMGLTHTAAKVIEVYGTNEQKEQFMKPLYQGKFAGTMCLTEPQAGSDVGTIQTRAVRRTDGSYSIVGQKIFITGGQHDLTENIIHIVLARIEGDPEGTKGLSCFVVPKIRIAGDGVLGEDNDVSCVGIEHKMGMKSSATCTLYFGDNGRCRGELLGHEKKGIVVTFHMMNEQRVLVGMQGLAQASTAYLHTLEYAKERHQGTELGKENSGQVPIIRHPDVKRNLLWMKSHTEGMRALIQYTAYCIDRLSVASSEQEIEKWQDLVGVLIPVCKAYCTDKGFEVCARSIQAHGGYGYCHSYMVEQFARDCKVASIYEGTNGIQAIDLFRRKIRIRGGGALRTVISQINEIVQEASRIGELSDYAQEVHLAISAFQEISDHLVGQTSPEEAYLADSWATPYLEILGDIILGWMFIWQAKVAYENMPNRRADELFYSVKVKTAKFYIHSILPVVHGKIEAIRKNEKSLVGMADEVF